MLVLQIIVYVILGICMFIDAFGLCFVLRKNFAAYISKAILSFLTNDSYFGKRTEEENLELTNYTIKFIRLFILTAFLGIVCLTIFATVLFMF